MNAGKIIVTCASVILCGCFAFADEVTTTKGVDEDKEKRLEEIIVDEARRTGDLPTTGRVNIQPIPVSLGRHTRIFQHNGIELIIRPVRLKDDGTYELDQIKGRKFSAIMVTLNAKGEAGSTRLKTRDDGKRVMDLPEAIYAITEVRYQVSNPIGRDFQFSDGTPHFDHRFCLAQRTIAFDVKNGETTDLGRLVLRGLEKRFKNERSIEHRPILGTDVPLVDISNPGFRNKSPEPAAMGIISFDPDGELCRESSRQVPGWFTNDEIKDVFPQFHVASAATN